MHSILFFIAYKCVDDIDCNLHGSCNKEQGQCICDIGWDGEQDCSGRPCTNDFECNNKESCDGLVCQCNRGWNWDAEGNCLGNNFNVLIFIVKLDFILSTKIPLLN